jgi:hypothetical protein
MMLKGVSFVHGQVVVLVVLACIPCISPFLVEMKFASICCTYVVIFLHVTACTAIMYSSREMLPSMLRINEVILIEPFLDRTRREAKRGLGQHR